MTIPPRWSELEDQDNFRAYASLGDGPICQHCGDPINYPSMSCGYSSHPLLDSTCVTCRDAEDNFLDDHVCPMEVGCGCCWNTHQNIAEQGNHNRFAANDTANDELYMGENIGPIVTGDSEENPEGVLVAASSWTTADVLPDAQPVMQENPVDPSAASVQADPNMQMPDASMSAPTMASKPFTHYDYYEAVRNSYEDRIAKEASWRSGDYTEIIQKEASDSDVYFKGYQDALSGKEMDEGMANLSMDYYQGYKQGLLYNETNLQSAPPSPESIDTINNYPLPKSAPYHPNFMPSELRGDVYPKVGKTSGFSREAGWWNSNHNGGDDSLTDTGEEHIWGDGPADVTGNHIEALVRARPDITEDEVHNTIRHNPTWQAEVNEEFNDKDYGPGRNVTEEEMDRGINFSMYPGFLEDYKNNYSQGNPSNNYTRRLQKLYENNEFNEEDWEKRFRESRKLREAARELNILRVCDGCGARDNVNLGRSYGNDQWTADGDDDYCPDCSYGSCPSCFCDFDEIDHQPSCNRFRNGGNCVCPPCGCRCHL
jgi:hypothetical protein